MLATRVLIIEESAGAQQCILQHKKIFQYRSICRAKSEIDIDTEIAFQSLHYFYFKGISTYEELYLKGGSSMSSQSPGKQSGL